MCLTGAGLSLSPGLPAPGRCQPPAPWEGAIFSVWCLPSDRGYLRRVRLVVSLGLQLESALGCAADGLRAGGFGEPLPLFMKCGRFLFRSALLPSPQRLPWLPALTRVTAFPGLVRWAHQAKCGFPALAGVFPPLINLWLTIRGLRSAG